MSGPPEDLLNHISEAQQSVVGQSQAPQAIPVHTERGEVPVAGICGEKGSPWW